MKPAYIAKVNALLADPTADAFAAEAPEVIATLLHEVQRAQRECSRLRGELAICQQNENYFRSRVPYRPTFVDPD